MSISIFNSIKFFLLLSFTGVLMAVSNQKTNNSNPNAEVDAFASFTKEELAWWSSPVDSKVHYQADPNQKNIFADFTEEELTWWSAPVEEDGMVMTAPHHEDFFANFTQKNIDWWNTPTSEYDTTRVGNNSPSSKDLTDH